MISLAFAFFFSISSPPWVYYSIKAATPQGVSDILCFAQSDIMPYGIVIFLLPQKWYYIRLLTARRAISLRRSLNITAKQYNSPKANITKKLLFFRTRVFLAPQVGLEPTTLRLTAACSTNWAIEEYLAFSLRANQRPTKRNSHLTTATSCLVILLFFCQRYALPLPAAGSGRARHG